MDVLTLRERIAKHTGHKVVDYDKTTRRITYICTTCGSTAASTPSNMTKTNASKFCSACYNSNNTKKNIDKVTEQLEELDIGYKLLEYNNNKDVQYECNLGHVFKMAFADIKRGRRCPSCAGDRRASTNLERYGSANVFASEQIKTKIKEKCIEKYGVDHHMKTKEVQEKRDNTMEEKHGLKYAFHSVDSFSKIRATC